MVIQKTIDNLKEKPKDERKVVAGGIAIMIMTILFIGWVFLFFKKIQHGGDLQLGGGAQEEFNFSSVREAQRELMEGFSVFDELRAVREQSAERYQLPVQEDSELSETDPFGLPSTSD